MIRHEMKASRIFWFLIEYRLGQDVSPSVPTCAVRAYVSSAAVATANDAGGGEGGGGEGGGGGNGASMLV